MKKDIIKDVLDTLAVALVGHKHQWSNKERRLYNKAIAMLT